MKKLFALCMAFVMCLTLAAETAGAVEMDADEDVILFDVPDGGILSFNSASGTIQDYTGNETLTDLVIPEQIDGTAVTAIAPGAFQGSSNLSTVSLPYSISNIGAKAFSSCTSLTSFSISCESGESLESVELQYENPTLQEDKIYYEIPAAADISIGEQAFSGCIHLYGVSISENVSSIGAYAFNGCRELRNFSVPNSLSEIDPSAFAGCASMESVDVLSGNGSYSSGGGALYDKDYESLIYCPAAFSGEFVVEDTVSTICANAFENCIQLENIVFPSSLTAIGDAAFRRCIALTRIQIPDGVTSIGANAFRECEDLEAVLIPASVTSIGEGAFADCSDNITLYVESGGYAEEYAKENGYTDGFEYVTDQSSFVPYQASSQISTAACGDAVYSYNTETGMITGVSGTATALTLPTELNGTIVTGIAASAFAKNETLKSVKIPCTIDSIDSRAFAQCTGLESVEFEVKSEQILNDDDNTTPVNTVLHGLSSIGAFAFQGCSSLKEVTLPVTLEQVSSDAFKGCTNLAAFHISSDSESYSVADGVLMSRDQTALFIYPEGLSNQEYTIPETVTQIGAQAFSGNHVLNRVTIPGGIQDISANAFDDTFITAFEFQEAEGVEIQDADSTYDGLVIGFEAFSNCVKLQELELPSHTAYIGARAFAGDTALVKLVIPASIVVMGDMSVAEVDSEEEAEIQNDAEDTNDDQIFEDCPSDLILYSAYGTLTETYAAYHGLNFNQKSAAEQTQAVEIGLVDQRTENSTRRMSFDVSSTETRQVKVVVALYNSKGKLSQAKLANVALEADKANSVQFQFSQNTEDAIYSVFALDNTSYSPLSKIQTGQLQA